MEIYKKLRVNNDTEFGCFFIDNFNMNSFSAVIKTDNYSSIENIFCNIEKLEIIDTNGLIEDMTTKFTSLESIKSILKTYTNEDGLFIPAYEIRLIPTNLEEQVKKLEEKVNPVINESSMTLDEFKAYKIKQLGESCTKAIYTGTEVGTSKGKEMFSYSLEDQSNLKDIFATATTTNLPCPYHSNSSICSIYPPEDIINIYLTLSGYKLYHTTYVNALNTYIRSLFDKTEISKVTYGQDVPEEYKENMDSVLAQGKLASEAILSANNPSKPETDVPIHPTELSAPVKPTNPVEPTISVEPTVSELSATPNESKGNTNADSK